MTLSEVCKLIVDCPHSTAKDEGDGYPLIRTPNIGKGRLLINGVHRVSLETYDIRNKRAVPQEDDLILAREAPVGNVAVVKENQKVCLGQRTVLIRPNKSLVDSDFLAYYLLSPTMQHILLTSSNGATVNHLNMSAIRGLEVDLPVIDEQRKIAGVLSKLADKIEINEKINRNLDEQLNTVFLESFPGIFNDGSNKLNEVVDFLNGKKRPKDEGDIPVYGGNGILSFSNISNASNCVIIGRVGAYCGSLYLSSEQCWISDNAIMAKAKNGNSQLFIYYLLWNLNLPSRHIGTSQPLLTQGILNAITINTPGDNEIENFCVFADVVQSEINRIKKENKTLILLRDSLLPKLMSGKLDVSYLNI